SLEAISTVDRVNIVLPSDVESYSVKISDILLKCVASFRYSLGSMCYMGVEPPLMQ
ncbi:8908_t:CDS:2, partial [Funneliformis geosporum]